MAHELQLLHDRCCLDSRVLPRPLYSRPAPARVRRGAGGDAVRAAKYRLAQSDEALLRVCRLCVSIRMHCQGMSVDEAAKFFQENCYYEAKPSRAEAVRGTYDPEYLYYTLGKLQFLK